MAVLFFSRRKAQKGLFYFMQKGTEGRRKDFAPVVVLLAGCPVAALVIWWAAHG